MRRAGSCNTTQLLQLIRFMHSVLIDLAKAKRRWTEKSKKIRNPLGQEHLWTQHLCHRGRCDIAGGMLFSAFALAADHFVTLGVAVPSFVLVS